MNGNNNNYNKSRSEKGGWDNYEKNLENGGVWHEIKRGKEKKREKE